MTRRNTELMLLCIAAPLVILLFAMVALNEGNIENNGLYPLLTIIRMNVQNETICLLSLKVSALVMLSYRLYILL